MAFRDAGASLLIEPTRDVWRAIERLQTLPTGGRTPLSAAVLDASSVVRHEQTRSNAAHVRVVLITDARSTQADLSVGVAALNNACQDICVIDTEDGFVRLGRARRLATLLNGGYVRPVA